MLSTDGDINSLSPDTQIECSHSGYANPAINLCHCSEKSVGAISNTIFNVLHLGPAQDQVYRYGWESKCCNQQISMKFTCIL